MILIHWAGKILKDLALVLGVQGPFKIDFIVDDEWGVCVGETATRQSGGYDQYNVPILTGTSPVDVALDWALGLPFDARHLEAKERVDKMSHACQYAPMYGAGKIDGWTGYEKVAKMPGLCGLYVREGAEIRGLVGNADRPLFVCAMG